MNSRKNSPPNTFNLDMLIPYQNNFGSYEREVKPPSDRLDAIIVPQGRPAPSIERPARLAHEVDATLISLGSHATNAYEVGRFIEGMGENRPPKSYAVDVPRGYKIPGHTATAHERIPLLARQPEGYNLPEKRNAGLVIGRMTGWRKILFHDDDLLIREAACRAGVRMLFGRRIAALECAEDGSPDRSVLQHVKLAVYEYQLSRRLFSQLKGPHSGQGSGNSLFADPQMVDGKFPEDIYNEDLFFIDRNQQNQDSGLANAGYTQDDYNPFQPERAAKEDFGDTIARGFAVQKKYYPDDPHIIYDKEFQRKVISTHRKDYAGVIESLGAKRNGDYVNYMVAKDDPNYLDPMPKEEQEMYRNVLLAGLEVNESFDENDVIDYLYALEQDQLDWNRMMRELPAGSVEEALSHLALTSYVTNIG